MNDIRTEMRSTPNDRHPETSSMRIYQCNHVYKQLNRPITADRRADLLGTNNAVLRRQIQPYRDETKNAVYLRMGLEQECKARFCGIFARRLSDDESSPHC